MFGWGDSLLSLHFFWLVWSYLLVVVVGYVDVVFFYFWVRVCFFCKVIARAGGVFLLLDD